MEKAGAMIERGYVAEVTEDGYRIQSDTRYGVLTPALKGLTNDTYAAGEIVYYFMFCDGRGMIIGRAE